MNDKSNYLTALIDTSAIIGNCEVLRQCAPKNSRICAAVKCNAYGHGVEIVTEALARANVDMLAVATISEAQQLRQLRWHKPILLLGSEFSIYQAKQKEEIAQWLIENDVRVTAMSKTDIESLAGAAKHVNKKAFLHLMLDTGMSRMGLDEQQLTELIDYIKDRREIQIEGLYTHFSTADETDKTFSNYQLKRFDDFIDSIKKSGLNIPIVHAANSAATIDLPQSHYDMIRPGISVYGYQPGSQMHNKADLKPALKLVSYLVLVKKITKGTFAGYGNTWQADKDTTIGLVPIGYGDGYNRALSNCGIMTVAGEDAPVVGRVSMDMTIIDLGPAIQAGAKVFPGQEVVIIDNNPAATNTVETIAEKLGTIPYEIVTRLGHRISRRSV